jgi:hypothetical protein
MDVSEAQQLKALDDESRRLKQVVADLNLEKWLELAGLRKDVALVHEDYKISERRACKLLAVDRTESGPQCRTAR